MKCLNKPVAFAVFSACLALAIIISSSVQQVEARAFRHDVQAQRPRPATANHILLRERYYTMKYHGVQDDEPVAPVEDEEMVPEIPGAATSDYESLVRRLSAALLQLFGSPSADQGPAKDFVIPDEVKFLVPATPMALAKRVNNGGKLCIAEMCGLNLFFASLWITFAACFAVVYLLDRQLHRKMNSDDDARKKNDETDSKPVSKAPAAVIMRSAVPTIHKRSMNGIRARMLNYYQDVTDMSSSLLHRRPLLGV